MTKKQSPGRTTRGHATTTTATSITVLVPVQQRPRDTCWRCGLPFAWTTDEVLRRCTELARAAS